MTKSLFMDKYPIFSYEVSKNETTFQNVDAIIEHLTALVSAHPVAKYIAVFDHHAHTSSMEDGVINDEIIAAKNFLFCFGKQLPSTKILAVRPRSVGISELADKFVIDTLEVPNAQLQVVLEEWVHSIKNN